MQKNKIDELKVKNDHGVDGTFYGNTSSTQRCVTSPTQICEKGQSVENAQYWFVIRATQGRAQKVYEKLYELFSKDENYAGCELYLPMVAIRQVDDSDIDNPIVTIVKRPLDTNLLFVNCLYEQYRELVKLPVAGLTPYYDHTRTTNYGSNPFLVVSNSQFNSFRTIIDSEVAGIITEQSDMPTFFKGDRVRVIAGPFAGVEGYVLRYKHQLRVFVRIDCLGTFATAYVPKSFLQKVK